MLTLSLFFCASNNPLIDCWWIKGKNSIKHHSGKAGPSEWGGHFPSFSIQKVPLVSRFSYYGKKEIELLNLLFFEYLDPDNKS